MLIAGNCNVDDSELVRDRDIALGAGGLTLGELHAIGIAKSEAGAFHYLDDMTNLWIPRGVLLFRKRPKAEAQRDELLLPDGD